jgi:hypothetical protein
MVALVRANEELKAETKALEIIGEDLIEVAYARVRCDFLEALARWDLNHAHSLQGKCQQGIETKGMRKGRVGGTLESSHHGENIQ